MCEMHEVLKGFSRGMYSNWLWHKPLQLLIDAGEGLQLALGANVFSPSVLAITHGHSDHVMGIPGLVASRRFGKGAVDKPLTVYYPEQSRGVQGVRELLGISYAGVVFPVTWTALAPGAIVPLGKTRSLHAFAVRHTAGEPALGYKVVETQAAAQAGIRGPDASGGRSARAPGPARRARRGGAARRVRALRRCDADRPRARGGCRPAGPRRDVSE